MWRLWAVAEGCTKTLSAIFQKLIGSASSLEMSCIAAVIIGGMQFSAGSIGKRVSASSVIPDFKSKALLVFLGFLAGIFGTVLSIYTFALGADLGIRTLLISFSIVPGAIIAAIVWPATDRLSGRQVFGVVVFLIAIWAMLDFPNLARIMSLEAWVWLTLLLAFVSGLGEVVSRSMAVKFDVWTNNLWVGGSTVLFSLLALAGITLFRNELDIDLSRSFVLGTLAVGAIVVAMISFKIFAYQGGGTIALKKIIMPGVYLVTAMLAGVLIYGESMTMGKVSGIILWFGSMYLADAKAATELRLLIVSRF